MPPGFARAIRAFWLLSLLGASIDLLSGLDEGTLLLCTLQWRKGREMAFEDGVDLLHGSVRLALHVLMITFAASKHYDVEFNLGRLLAVGTTRSALTSSEVTRLTGSGSV